MSLKIALMLVAFSLSAHAEEILNLGAEGRAAVDMQDVNGEFVLTVRLPNGRPQKIREEFVPFEFEDSQAAIGIADFDGDGTEEFVVRAMIPPQSGALYIYRYSSKEKKFVPMVTGKSADDTFLPVDAVAPVRINRDGTVTARIIERTEFGESTVDRRYRLVRGKFKRLK